MSFFKVKENITALVALLIAILALFTSFVGTDAEVYLFPRIAAVIIFVLAVGLMIQALMNQSTAKEMTAPLFIGKA